MAKSRVQTKNGSLALPTGYALDTQSMRISESQQSIDVTVYGATTYGANLGSGTPIMRITASGFPYKGATGSNPGFGNMAAAGGDIGATATATVDTGCTLAGAFLAERLDMDHARPRPGAMTTLDLLNAGDITPTWATT